MFTNGEWQTTANIFATTSPATDEEIGWVAGGDETEANDTHYGLAAYVFTQNLSKAMRTFEGLNFRIVGFNGINPTGTAAPFGGMNQSGLGREGTRAGIMEYLETKLGGFVI